MRRTLALFVMPCLGTLWGAQAHALDCRPVGDPSTRSRSQYPRPAGVGSMGVPANVFFDGGAEEEFESPWVDEAGVPLTLIRDPFLSALFEGSQAAAASRPEAPLEPGSTYTYAECGGVECLSFTVGEEDTTPPERAEVSALKVRFIKNGDDGGGFSCPDRDFLSMRVGGSDDRADDVDLIILAYIAPTEESLAEQAIPELVFPLPSGSDDPRSLNFALGVSGTRARDGAHFRKSAPYCFALALMDRAGNIGERSEPLCISTVDQSGPYAEVVVNSGCCAVPGGREPARPAALLLACLFALARARRPRRR